MGRQAKHNWRKLFLEYGQGRYKSVAEFAKAKDLHPVAVRREFKKFEAVESDPEIEQNETKKRNKTEQKSVTKKETKQKTLHPWETLKQQFTDWPEEKLQAYLLQIEERRHELLAVSYEELSKDEQKELGRLSRERRVILSDPDPSRQCKRIKKDGKQCRNPVERGKESCWNHGGAPGIGTQPGQQHNLKHGFYAKIMPDDPEIQAIIEGIDAKSPIDILWDQIVIQYTAIARAQRIMYVKDREKMIKELKRSYEKNSSRTTEKTSSDSNEGEYENEFQFAWDRQATFLTAQSKAMTTLEKLIARYEAMATDEQKLKVQKLKQDMDIAKEKLELEKSKVMGDPDETEDDGFIEALHGKAGEAWDEYGDSDNGSTDDSPENTEED